MFRFPVGLQAWSEHPLLVYPIIRDMPEVLQAPQVQVKSLEKFLLEEEAGLEKFFAEHEEYARQHFPHYRPRPEFLDFTATGNHEDIKARFLKAIRINPHAKTALYLYLLPGEDCGAREYMNPYELTTLISIYEMLFTTYVRIYEGEMISPQYVLATATNEPDYGLDLGLFSDNGTDWGAIYGFGEQSFGNPALEYGSQAPFHMGFYHESWLVFAAAPFLKKTYVEYRIHLYKSLASYAFQHGQDYWGWRFLGWAIHYLNDMSMPYHTSVLPAKRSLPMIWINLKAMLGFKKSRDNQVLLLSNRHTVYEHFQWETLLKAHQENDEDHPYFKALLNPIEIQPYDDDFPRNVAAREAAKLARRHDKMLCRFVPAELVSDPAYSITGSKDLAGLADRITAEKGHEAATGLAELIASRFHSLSMHTRSFIRSVINPKTASS